MAGPTKRRNQLEDHLPKSRRWFLRDVQAGSVTLVLGAGISSSRGVPGWTTLVRDACREVGYSPSGASWLTEDDVAPPTFLEQQIALEAVEHSLRSVHKSEDNPVAAARRAFARLLTKYLYVNKSPGTGDSLALLAAVLRQEQQRASPRVSRVITLNADDLLEVEANADHSPERDPVVWPIARASHHPRRQNGAHGKAPIPIYHVHGYLPQDGSRGAEDSLVFTDSQYWESMARPLSLSNRIFMTALHDSHCVFIGLSMTDLNVNRWLGLRALEVEAAKLDDYRQSQRSMNGALRSIRKALTRHYWIRTPNSASSLFEDHLQRRGVVTIPIDDWRDDLAGLLTAAFPE